MFSLFNFSSIFQGSADPIYPYVRTPMAISIFIDRRTFERLVDSRLCLLSVHNLLPLYATTKFSSVTQRSEYVGNYFWPRAVFPDIHADTHTDTLIPMLQTVITLYGARWRLLDYRLIYVCVCVLLAILLHGLATSCTIPLRRPPSNLAHPASQNRPTPTSDLICRLPDTTERCTLCCRRVPRHYTVASGLLRSSSWNESRRRSRPSCRSCWRQSFASVSFAAFRYFTH